MGTVYFSTSDHGKGQNKCLWNGCYEDKHTRPAAEVAAKILREEYGHTVIVASEDKSIFERVPEAEALKADIYVPWHTNAFKDPAVRYFMMMFWANTDVYKGMFNTMVESLKDVYDDDFVFSVRDDLYEISSPSMKTLYIEGGFHTNQYDCDNFIHEYEKIGRAVAEGINNILGGKVEQKSVEKVVEEDKLWGTETTKYTQILFGTPQDGTVSNQLYSYKDNLLNMISTSWEFENVANGGSVVIKALQEFLKAQGYYTGAIDGYAGKLTVIAMQKFLASIGLYAGVVDGVAGELTVLGWQKYLNLKLAV